MASNYAGLAFLVLVGPLLAGCVEGVNTAGNRASTEAYQTACKGSPYSSRCRLQRSLNGEFTQPVSGKNR